MPKSESGRRCGTSPATRAVTSAGPDTSRSVSSAASSPILAAATGMSPPPAAETSPVRGPDEPGQLGDIPLTSGIASAFLLGPATDHHQRFHQIGALHGYECPIDVPDEVGRPHASTPRHGPRRQTTHLRRDPGRYGTARPLCRPTRRRGKTATTAADSVSRWVSDRIQAQGLSHDGRSVLDRPGGSHTDHVRVDDRGIQDQGAKPAFPDMGPGGRRISSTGVTRAAAMQGLTADGPPAQPHSGVVDQIALVVQEPPHAG